MRKWLSINTKHFNPYDLNDVADVDKVIKQHPFQKNQRDDDKEKREQRGILKSTKDEEKRSR